MEFHYPGLESSRLYVWMMPADLAYDKQQNIVMDDDVVLWAGAETFWRKAAHRSWLPHKLTTAVSTAFLFLIWWQSPTVSASRQNSGSCHHRPITLFTALIKRTVNNVPSGSAARRVPGKKLNCTVRVVKRMKIYQQLERHILTVCVTTKRNVDVIWHLPAATQLIWQVTLAN